MGKKEIEDKVRVIVQERLGSLNAVTRELIDGVDADEFLARHRGKSVAPGVTVGQYFDELQSGNCLRREGNRVFLLDSCNPVKLLSPA